MSLPHPAAASPDELAPGTRVGHGRFIVEAIIGRGGVATVYRVRTEANERLALKVMLQRRARDPAQRDRFDNERRILEALAGVPYVVDLVEAGQLSDADPRPYIALELLRGPTLDQLLHGERVKAETRIDRACRVVRQVADALADLHARGVVHRDIKPENIVVEPGGTIRLLDFGYAHSSGAGVLPNTAGLTRAEHRPGTYLYMAPEQALGHPPSASFDVYALAVTLYEALAGHAPNHALAVPEMARIKCEMREPELSIAGRAFGVPPELVALVDAGLRRAPSERLASAAELRDRLDEIIAALPTESSEDLALTLVRHGEALVSTPPAASTVDTEKTPRSEPDQPMVTEPVDPEPSVATAVIEARPARSRTTELAAAVSQAEAPRGAAAKPARSSAAVRWGIAIALASSVAMLAALWPSNDDEQRAHETAVPGQDTGTPHVAAPAMDTGSSGPEPVDEGGQRRDAALEDPDETTTPKVEAAPPDEVEPEPIPDVPKTETSAKPRAPSARPCEDVAGQAAEADEARRYARVLKLTRSSRCWNDHEQRLSLRVHALSETGRYQECVDVGAKSSAAATQRLVKHCKRQLEEREPK
ncbi:MAG: protein kinase [Nannocystaceae bacterium]